MLIAHWYMYYVGLEEDEQNHTSQVVDDGVILPHETRQVIDEQIIFLCQGHWFDRCNSSSIHTS